MERVQLRLVGDAKSPTKTTKQDQEPVQKIFEHNGQHRPTRWESAGLGSHPPSVRSPILSSPLTTNLALSSPKRKGPYYHGISGLPRDLKGVYSGRRAPRRESCDRVIQSCGQMLLYKTAAGEGEVPILLT